VGPQERLDVAVQMAEGGGGFGERFAELDSGGLIAEAGLVDPELIFDAVVAAEEPFVADHLIDQETLFDCGGGEFREAIGLELSELFGGLADDDLRCGVETGLEGVVDRRHSASGYRTGILRDAPDGPAFLTGGHLRVTFPCLR
jgi:hypothetical protein